MTKNDIFYKILFAVMIALLPMTIFANIYLTKWALCLFICAILVVKIWLEVFKDKYSQTHQLISVIGTALTFTTLLIMFAVSGVISKPLAIVTVILVDIFCLFTVLFRNKNLPDMIDAVDYCFMLFECLTLLALSFVTYNITMTNISLFALILTTAASVAYKIYYAFRYMGIWDKIVRLFRKK